MWSQGDYISMEMYCITVAIPTTTQVISFSPQVPQSDGGRKVVTDAYVKQIREYCLLFNNLI